MKAHIRYDKEDRPIVVFLVNKEKMQKVITFIKTNYDGKKKELTVYALENWDVRTKPLFYIETCGENDRNWVSEKDNIIELLVDNLDDNPDILPILQKLIPVIEY